MRVLPILFNAEMVRAILDGRKRVARLVMKPSFGDSCPNCNYIHNEFIYDKAAQNVYCARCGESLYNGGFPYKAPYHPGDILYVRETWTFHASAEGGIIFKARCPEKLAKVKKWHPSIHMPKRIARIWLKVTDVRVERLKDITEEQAQKEGCTGEFIGTGENVTPIEQFAKLWDTTIKSKDNTHYGRDANPWVWVIEFERCKKPMEVR